ncbi:MAG: hypothetical protein I4N51_04245 [Acinetobacter sp.]|nr:hypothetical protein [Acinetobacter sp.]
MPTISMRLRRANPWNVLKVITNREQKIKHIDFEIIVQDEDLFRMINEVLQEVEKEKGKEETGKEDI